MTGALVREGEPYCGHDGLDEYMRDVAEVWDELELVPGEFHDLDSGETLVDSPNIWLWRLRESKILSASVLGDTESALALLRAR